MQVKLPFLNRQRKKRQAWEASLQWRRVRYRSRDGLEKCMRWLTSGAKIRRLGLLFHKEDSVSQLFLGVPQSGVKVFEQMGQDYGFETAPMPGHVQIPADCLLSYTETLTWNRSFYAQFVDGQFFIESDAGHCFPQKVDAPATEWELPHGVGLHLEQTEATLASCETAFAGNKGWPLGIGSQQRLPLRLPGRITLYGSGEATAHWLTALALRLLADAANGLIILDGSGALVPLLKRHTVVVERLERDLCYIDMDAPFAAGFDPMAKVPFETEAQYLTRIKQWFVQMGVPTQSIPLIEKAVKTDRIRTFLAFVQWLDAPEQQRRPKEIGRIKGVIARLLANRAVRDRLEWPTNPFATLPNGTLLFSCQQHGWAQTQILFSLLLGCMQSPTPFLILHGIDWHSVEAMQLYPLIQCPNVIISNGPPLTQGRHIFTATHPDRARQIVHHFFENDAFIEERLNRLKLGQALVVNREGQMAFTQWGVGKRN